MIPANKKVSFTEVPAGLTNQLSQTFATNDEGAKETPVETKVQAKTVVEEKSAEIKTVTKVVKKNNSVISKTGTKKNDRPGQINICLPPEIKTEWKLLFTKNNVNITQGIIFAVEHLKNEIEKGEAILTVGGVISKK